MKMKMKMKTKKSIILVAPTISAKHLVVLYLFVALEYNQLNMGEKTVRST